MGAFYGTLFVLPFTQTYTPTHTHTHTRTGANRFVSFSTIYIWRQINSSVASFIFLIARVVRVCVCVSVWVCVCVCVLFCLFDTRPNGKPRCRDMLTAWGGGRTSAPGGSEYDVHLGPRPSPSSALAEPLEPSEPSSEPSTSATSGISGKSGTSGTSGTTATSTTHRYHPSPPPQHWKDERWKLKRM